MSLESWFPFIFVLSGNLLLLFIVQLSILKPKYRIWPPPKKDGWQQLVSWTLFTISMFGVPLLGILDYESLGKSISWIHFLIGSLPIVIGFAIDLWGTKTLSAQQSLGGTGKIITEGPYRLTRNPQYVGFILIYSGIIIATYSVMALVTGLILIVTFFVLPLSEEPWLKQQYGKSFEDYCKRVPRFIGLRSINRVTNGKLQSS